MRLAELESQVLAAVASGAHHGYDLTRATGIRPGRLYPILWGLERDGRLVATFEPGPYPRRRRYDLTDAAEMIAE